MMNNDLHPCATLISRGRMHRIEDGQGNLVQCLSGTLWLTQQGDRRDIVLEAGQEALIERGGLSILSALTDARYVLLRQPVPAVVPLHARPASAAPTRW
jgi:hypothetical protein